MSRDGSPRETEPDMSRPDSGSVAAIGSPAWYAMETVRLRAALRDAIQTLSNARRSDVWEIVNELVALEGRSAPPNPETPQ